MAFQNKMKCRFVNARVKRGMNASTLCEKMVKIGSVTSEFKKGVYGIFTTTGQKTGQKLAYSIKYLSNLWTNLYQTFSFGSHV